MGVAKIDEGKIMGLNNLSKLSKDTTYLKRKVYMTLDSMWPRSQDGTSKSLLKLSFGTYVRGQDHHRILN